MSGKKIVFLGAGSLYFRRVLGDVLVNPLLSDSELVLYDLVPEKADRMAAVGARLAAEAGTGCVVRVSQGVADAVDGADFAISSIGGSGAGMSQRVYDSYYHNADVRIAASYGIRQIIGDTAGPGAMMMALRSIPAYLGICREMEKRCPRVILFSHSNPMAVLCRAMHKYTDINVIGICHGVQAGIREVASLLDIPMDELDCLWVGTNHYYWLTRVAHRGVDLYSRLMELSGNRPPPEKAELSHALSTIYGHRILYSPDDHIIEFYPFLAQYRDSMEAFPAALAAEAEKRLSPDFEGGPEPTPEARRRFFREYQALLDSTVLPAAPSDPLVGEGIGAILGAISHGRRQVCIANIANNGCIPNLPRTAEVEVEALTDSCGVRGLQMGEAPLHLKGILEKRFVWHELVADAAVKGDRNLALQALMIDEVAVLPDRAREMLDALLAASRELLPQFA